MASPVLQTNYNLTDEAFAILKNEGTVTFSVNRGRTFMKIAHTEHVRVWDQSLIKHCKDHSSEVTEASKPFYFLNSDKVKCFVDDEMIARFTKIAKEAFPELYFTREFSLVERESNIEVFELRNETQFIQPEDNPLSIKISEWIAHSKKN